jgi:hypothetical protein
MQVVKSKPMATQVSEVMEKSRFGEPPVRTTSDVRVPPAIEVSATVTGAEVAPTAVVPGNVSGVEIWAQAAGTRKLIRTVDHRFDMAST